MNFHPEKKTTQAIGDTGLTVLLFAVTIGAGDGLPTTHKQLNANESIKSFRRKSERSVR
jgi:hypothetical protein